MAPWLGLRPCKDADCDIDSDSAYGYVCECGYGVSDYDGDGICDPVDNCPNNGQITSTDFRGIQAITLVGSFYLPFCVF